MSHIWAPKCMRKGWRFHTVIFWLSSELRPLRSDQRPWNLALWKWHRRPVRSKCTFQKHAWTRSGWSLPLKEVALNGVAVQFSSWQLIEWVCMLENCTFWWTSLDQFDATMSQRWDFHSKEISMIGGLLVNFFEVESLRWRVSALQRPGAAALNFEGKSAMKIDTKINDIKISCRRHSHLQGHLSPVLLDVTRFHSWPVVFQILRPP